jgi:hypothetical protein
LAETLKTTAKRNCALGVANTDGVYFKAWEDQDRHIQHKYSHMFMRSRTVQHRRRKLILQYRWGLLPTNKLLSRYKLSNSDNCPLCNQPDGGHHALSACPALSGAVTKRHNDTASLIVQAIHNGNSAAELVMSDVGMSRRCAGLKRRIRLRCKPDAMMVKTENNTWQYELIEIKYCRDTDPTQQESRADRQHDRLMKMLSIFDPRAEVKLTTIMLGVSGCIYRRTEQKLKGLGIQGAALSSFITFTYLLYYFITWQLNTWRKSGTRDSQQSRTPDTTPHPPGGRGNETCMGSQCLATGNERNCWAPELVGWG